MPLGAIPGSVFPQALGNGRILLGEAAEGCLNRRASLVRTVCHGVLQHPTDQRLARFAKETGMLVSEQHIDLRHIRSVPTA